MFASLRYPVLSCNYSDMNGLSMRNEVNGLRQVPCGEKNRSTTSRDLNVSL